MNRDQELDALWQRNRPDPIGAPYDRPPAAGPALGGGAGGGAKRALLLALFQKTFVPWTKDNGYPRVALFAYADAVGLPLGTEPGDGTATAVYDSESKQTTVTSTEEDFSESMANTRYVTIIGVGSAPIVSVTSATEVVCAGDIGVASPTAFDIGRSLWASLPPKASRDTTAPGIIVTVVEIDGSLTVGSHTVTACVVAGVLEDCGFPIRDPKPAAADPQMLPWGSDTEPDAAYGYTTGWEILVQGDRTGMFLVLGDANTVKAWTSGGAETHGHGTATSGGESLGTAMVRNDSYDVEVAKGPHTHAVTVAEANHKPPWCVMNFIKWVGLTWAG